MDNELKIYMAPEQALLARSQHGFSVKGCFWPVGACREGLRATQSGLWRTSRVNL